MELNLIKEQMAHDYSRSIEIYPDVEAAVDSAFKAGFDARQQLLQQTIVSGSLPLVEILDMLNKAHEALAKSEISQDNYRPINWALVDAKKRISVLLSGNDR